MLITFQSKAAGDVLMYKDHAKPILDLLNKDIDRGIITAAEAPNAVATIEKEIAESRTQPDEQVQRDDVQDAEAGDEANQAKVQAVSFSTRAYPLLDMLRAAAKGGYDVVWGV